MLIRNIFMVLSILVLVSACSAHLALATVEKELDNQLDYIESYGEQMKEMEADHVY